MLNYLKNSEISVRIGFNPVNWKWIPGGTYEAPTVFYPKRKTLGVAFLFLQIFIDIDDGSTDLSSLQNLFGQTMDIYDADEVGSEIPKTSKRSRYLEQGPVD